MTMTWLTLFSRVGVGAGVGVGVGVPVGEGVGLVVGEGVGKGSVVEVPIPPQPVIATRVMSVTKQETKEILFK